MPAKLILSLNQSVLGEYPLDKERIVLGRKAENDIQVDNLAVSGQHAAIITILNDSFLEDLESTNGTFVNGKLVKKHALKNGDVIQIGKHELKYMNDDASGDEDDFEKTMIIRPGMASHAAAAAKADEAPSGPPPGAAASRTLGWPCCALSHRWPIPLAGMPAAKRPRQHASFTVDAVCALLRAGVGHVDAQYALHRA